MRRGLVAALLIIAAAGAGAGTYYKTIYEPQNGSIFEAKAEKENSVAVDSVAVIAGISNASGIIQRYAGVVEAQQEWSAKADADKKIVKTYVKEGDMVEAGDDLFVYDTSTDEQTIEKNEIALDRLANDNDSRKTKIEQLEKQVKAASDEEEKLSLQTQILSEENQIKQNNYDAKTTAQEIENLKEAIKSSTVRSEIAGIVKSVGKKSSSSMSDESEGYITIMAVGDLRVKGYANEQNINLISDGMQVIAYSRVNPKDTWTGSITEIKHEGEKNSGSEDSFYSMGDPSTTSSKYPFYVSLDDTAGLLLGQHLYIEEDLGQNDEIEGLWIYDYYIETNDEGQMFVWAEGKNEKIEKRIIEVGEFDEEQSKYEVVSGLTAEDYIAVPGQEIEEGQAVTHTEFSNSDDEAWNEYLYEETEGWGEDEFSDQDWSNDSSWSDGENGSWSDDEGTWDAEDSWSDDSAGWSGDENTDEYLGGSDEYSQEAEDAYWLSDYPQEDEYDNSYENS